MRRSPLAAHAYGILAHYTTLARQLEELDEHGFDADPAVFASEGPRERLEVSDNTRDVGFFHLVATAGANWRRRA